MRKIASPEEKLLRLIKEGKKKTKAPAAKHTEFNLTAKYLFVFFIISCLFLISTFIYPLFNRQKIELSTNATVDETPLKEIETKPSQQKPYDFYLQGIQGRQIFSAQVSSPEQTGETTGIINPDATKDINLIGIIAGNNPQAIMEDKKTQKTYYIRKGQSIGEFQVEDIQEGKVILIYQGQKFELTL